MNTDRARSADVLPASTVVLLSDRPDGRVEVFLMRRHARSGFMAGATVFPGGKVDQVDHGSAAGGRTAADCAQQLGLADGESARSFFIAAVRELHEEAHVLLARDADGRIPAADRVDAIDARLEDLRDGHRLPDGAWHDILASEGLVPALDLIWPFAHWVTPRIEPRRFDTFFFVACHPLGQRASADLHESTGALWMSPRAALLDHERGGPIVLPPPTLHTLERLQISRGDAAAVAAALADGGVGPRIEPYFLADSADGPVIALPGDPLHPHAGAGNSNGPASLDRFVLAQGRFCRQVGERNGQAAS